MAAPFHEDPEKANSQVQPPCEDAAGDLTLDAIEMVDWDGEADPANPRNWPARRRWGNVCLISMITIITPLASSMFAPAVPDMMKEFRDDSSAMASLVVSVYVVGFALGPLVFAPLSEIYGRLYVYHVCNVLFLVFTAGCALSTQTGMFVAFRLLAGCVGATPMVLGGGSIADIIPPSGEGRP
ncbi:membrane transporter [Colletotrichum higginsianum]|uniref:Membrane transporter n=1 Tax=Colletotrichum higginsianum (strain IMI 349063) TaxID=759273 RepID=H1VNY5_COLHI|nr:Membrane transporter [Colletotrichum higginsianum IMI 349063]OBR14691.1 Membrane transporter [Colletotrichum higginsianum IMI 349063]CCF41939.1 membrane transporter [Colletotrichum higginsianum]